MNIQMTPIKFCITLAVFYFVIICSIVVYLFAGVATGLPSLEQLENPRQNLATQIISADGKLLDHFYVQRRVSLPLDSIPKDFVNALIAVEDRDFYSHWGVNVWRAFGAVARNIASFKAKQGFSTITMQLSRNLYFSQEKTLKRKLQEIVTSLQIEKAFTKKEILEMYTNTVNFGRGAYGLQVASEVYFDKAPMQLSLAECAYLVGILKAPERYNGLGNYERAIQRRNLVLSMMKDQGYINDNDYNNTTKEPINMARLRSPKSQSNSVIAPHFVEMIRQQLGKDLNLQDVDLYRDGLIIKTTLDSRIQKYAEEAVSEHLAKFQETFNRSWSWSRNEKLLSTLLHDAVRSNPEYAAAQDSKKKDIESRLLTNSKFVDSIKNLATTVQIGLVVINPRTGAILAMVGASPKFMNESGDAKYSLNHVTQIRRQPGSTFKPFVYASALMSGMTPESQIECGPYTYTLPSGETWSPRGTGRCSEKGSYSLFTGLSQSVNTMSARLITQHTSPAKVIELAKKMGVESPLRAVPALALGAGGEVTPLEMTSAFGVFVNDGIHVKPYYAESVEDQFGNLYYEKKRSSESSDALPTKTAREMCKMMQGVVNYGTGWVVKSYIGNLDAAGKTGTTNDYADAWFIGYTPQLVAGLWVGFDNRRITFTGDYAYAARAAAPVWGLLMKKIYADPTLPYKQRRFDFLEAQDLDSIANAEKDDDIYNKAIPEPPDEPDDSEPANDDAQNKGKVNNPDTALAVVNKNRFITNSILLNRYL